jgi:hypothetical protein
MFLKIFSSDRDFFQTLSFFFLKIFLKIPAGKIPVNRIIHPHSGVHGMPDTTAPAPQNSPSFHCKVL